MRCRITVVRKASYPELSAKYENPISHACTLSEGDCFWSEGGERPANLCESAWQNLQPFVFALCHGGENFFGGWMKNPRSAMISCNDGFRPVSFLLEAEKPPDAESETSAQRKEVK